VRDWLVNHNPLSAQGAAPTGDQHLPSWEQHPVRDLLADQRPYCALGAATNGGQKLTFLAMMCNITH
jgi:hypothetical protein